MSSEIRLNEFFEAVERGDEASVKLFIAENRVSSDNKNTKGETAAHIAAAKGHTGILRYLLKNDIGLLQVKNKAKEEILHVGVRKGALVVVQCLIDDFNVHPFDEAYLFQGSSAVHLAAQYGQLPILKYFIEEKRIDPNALNEFGEPLIFSAAGNKQLNIVKYLYEECNADVTMVDYRYRNILFAATMCGDLTIPAYILDGKKIDLEIDWRDNLGRTVTHWAAMKNYLKLITYYVDYKHADVNMPDSLRSTPLHLAAEAGHIKIVEYLYETGADPELEDMYGRRPLQVAVGPKVMQFLTDFQIKRNRRSAPELTNVQSHEPNPLASKWILRMSADKLYSKHRLDGDRFTGVGRVDSLNLNGLLTLADVCVRYSGNSNKLESLLSPRDIVESRIDPIAVDSVDTLLSGTEEAQVFRNSG